MDRASPRSGRPPAGASAASLARFVSAPGSFLSTLVDTVAASTAEFPATEPAPPLARTRFFPGGESPCLTSESTAELHRPCGSGGKCRSPPGAAGGGELEIGLQQPYGGGPAAALLRHSSSPAGFLSHLMVDSGFSVTRGGEYPQAGNQSIHGMNGRRLKPQLSFSSRQDSLSHISEMGISETRDDAAANPYAASGFQIGSWDEHNSIIFPANSGKRGRSTGGDIAATLSSLDSQYGLSRTALDLENVENLFQIQQDSVPCKIRAKRGCATHPRSIAERERRSRISEKLKKLQELVPNMDKQTSTADMLDLAVQHIKGLQTQVQRLNQECAGCTCGSKLEIS